MSNPTTDTPAGDWKTEAIRGFWQRDPATIRFLVSSAIFCGLVWFFTTRSDALADKFFSKLDGHVETLKQRDIVLDQQQGQRLERVVQECTRTVSEVKEMARDLRDSYRDRSVGAKP